MSSSNYSFISEPDPNLKCSICLDLASLPKQCEDCGKLFCSECIEKSGRKPCPNCRASNPRYFRDVKSGRDIKAIKVRCNNKERGCPWCGTIGTLDTHLTTSEFALVPCPNKCEDDEDAGEIQLMRKDLDNHLKTKCLKRPFKCQHCGEKGTYASITGDHDKICKRKMVACPNKGSGCTLSVERGKTKQHVSVCEYTEVACEYESLGCGVRMLRKNVEKHNKEYNTRHLQLMLKKYSLREEHHLSLSEGEALVFKLSGYASKKEKNELFYSAPFYTHPGGYKMYIEVYVNGCGDYAGTHMSIFTKIIQGRYDDTLPWPFKGTISYELLNQLINGKHYKRVLVLDHEDDMQVNRAWGYSSFFPHSSLCHDPTTNTQYLLDDTLYFRVSVKVDNHKPWLVCTDKLNMGIASMIDSKTTLKNGESFTFKITGYNTQRAGNTEFKSDSFYTSQGGYKMCIEICTNGDGSCKDTHVSVFSKLLEGSYDASLLWPFLGTVTFTLLNQLSDENHHSQVLEYETTTGQGKVGKYWGYQQFISQSALCHDPVKNTQYLKNDTLYFRVSVKDNIHKSWLTCTNN